MSEEEKILKTIRYCANDYMKQEDGIQCFEWGDLWVLNEYIEKIKQENQQLKENNMSMQEEMVRTWGKVDLYKEVIEEVKNVLEKYRWVKVEDYKKVVEFYQKIESIIDKTKENK